MKKVVCALLSILMLVSFAGCGKSSKSLCQQGTEVVSMMTEMTESEPYLDALGGNPEMKEKVLHIGTKTPETPDRVYEVKLDENAVLGMMNLNDLDSFSPDLQNALLSRIYSVMASQINASEGVAALAASSACTASKTFCNDQLRENTLLLYLYRDGAPVLVSFTTGGDGIVSASGSFLFKDTASVTQDTLASWFGVYAGEIQLVAGR